MSPCTSDRACFSTTEICFEVHSEPLVGIEKIHNGFKQLGRLIRHGAIIDQSGSTFHWWGDVECGGGPHSRL